MYGVGILLIWLAIKKEYEPALLLPMGFGAILVNLPLSGVLNQVLAGVGETSGIIEWLFHIGIEVSEAMPVLLFLGIGAMIDFGPLLSNPKMFLFGAGAQFGIFAAILLAVLLGGTVFLSTNAQAREAFFGWVREQVEGAQRYFHQGNVTSASEIVHYQIDIPEGYWLEDSLEAEGYFDYYYVNDDGDSIEFTYQYETEAAGGELYVDDRETEKKQVMVCGTPGELYLSNEEETSNTVIWMDQSTGALIDVTAFLEENALLGLAETVTTVEK